MQISIDDVPSSALGFETVPLDIFGYRARKPRGPSANKVPPKPSYFGQRAMERYIEAHRRLFHLAPEITYDGTYFRIHGLGYGVKRKRLLEMAKQLEFRAG